MRVLHVIDRLDTGGAEQLFVSITSLLCDKITEAGALLFTSGGPLEEKLDKRVTIHRLNRSNKFNVYTLYKAHKVCAGYDIVHAHLRHVYVYIRLAQFLFGGKYKLVVHDHAAITNDVPTRFKSILKPQYYIGVNEEQVNWVQSVVGVAKEQTFLLENTILHSGNPVEDTSEEDRAMIVANIRRVKNIEFAVDLCRSMNWQLDIYGNVIEQDYYHQLKEKAESTALIHNGVTDFKSIYPQHKLAIHCSPKETGPLVLIEYLSVGLPFIAYRTGSAADAIASELPQLFMDNFEISDWKNRIKEILNDESLPGKMRKVYTEKFNPEQYINKCLEIYESVQS